MTFCDGKMCILTTCKATETTKQESKTALRKSLTLIRGETILLSVNTNSILQGELESGGFPPLQRQSVPPFYIELVLLSLNICNAFIAQSSEPRLDTKQELTFVFITQYCP